MVIYGQFNLGFLIVGHRQDLFIVDQHATDEKYNFETLQRTTTIGSQRMVKPQRLELTAVGESVVIEHLAVFQRNGFQFLVDSEAPPTQRVQLTHLPTRQGGNSETA
jgi:DNA mismatch repair protein PMS2